MVRKSTHYMNLYPAPFLAIKTGVKTVEMRLNDEKREKIEQGDYIIFTNNETKEELLVRVEKRVVYPSFRELYSEYDKISIGYKKDEIANPNDMLIYYTEEKIKKYGALALELSLVHK